MVLYKDLHSATSYLCGVQCFKEEQAWVKKGAKAGGFFTLKVFIWIYIYNHFLY